MNSKTLSAIVVVGVAVLAVVVLNIGLPVLRIEKKVEFRYPSDHPVYFLLVQAARCEDIQEAARRDLPRSLTYVSSGRTLLCWAVEFDRADVVAAFLDLGMKPDECGGYPPESVEVPLCTAVSLDNVEITKMLLDAGADPDRADNLGLSARQYAMHSKNEETKRLLRSAVSPPKGR